ncbi:MAG: hypothetical protein ABWZ26_07315 [Candidatus Nanopelagicales bacterium]
MPDRSAVALAIFMTGAGAMHFAAPKVYEPLIPPILGPRRPWIYGSGAAEIACAVAVGIPATRRTGGYAMAGLYVALLTGNVQMAIDAWRGGSTTRKVLTTARLPLQIPLVVWALRVAQSAPR